MGDVFSITGRADIKLYNQDCMPALEAMEENQFDLAIVDPPYGIGDWTTGTSVYKDKNGNINRIKNNLNNTVNWNEDIPSKKYFNILDEKVKNHIIWGANYYNCFNNGNGALVWHKGNINPTFSQCEIASLSFQKKVDYVKINWQAGFYREKVEGEQIHPCQKPVKLYKWLLKNYAEEGDTILDTHLGSGSIAIACWDMGFDLVGYELDEDYFEKACKRIKKHTNQMQLF